MKILQNYYVLEQLELPTIEWKQFSKHIQLDEDLLWSIKVEDLVKKNKDVAIPIKQKHSIKSFQRLFKDRRCINKKEDKALIGVNSSTARVFGMNQLRHLDENQMVIYYPYYTVLKSGIIDLNQDRVVIEATKGDITNMNKYNHIDVTMIFQEDDLTINGDEHLFTQEEMLPVIDYSRMAKKAFIKELDENKNIQLYFSYLHHTNVNLKPVGESKLIFYRFKIF